MGRRQALAGLLAAQEQACAPVVMSLPGDLSAEERQVLVESLAALGRPLARLQKAFQRNGMEFSEPRVTVESEDDAPRQMGAAAGAAWQGSSGRFLSSIKLLLRSAEEGEERTARPAN